MRRNLELENWLIETTGEEMMANHLGPNWNRFNEDVGFYPNMTMTVADQVWQHQQSKVDELQKRVDAVNGLIEDLNKCYQQDHQNKFEYWRGFADSAGILGKRLEQALKGGLNE